MQKAPSGANKKSVSDQNEELIKKGKKGSDLNTEKGSRRQINDGAHRLFQRRKGKKVERSQTPRVLNDEKRWGKKRGIARK